MLALILELRQPDISARDRAARNLKEMMPGAAARVREFSHDPDPEVAARCREILYIPPDDWTWYQRSGLNGIDLELLQYQGFLTHW